MGKPPTAGQPPGTTDKDEILTIAKLTYDGRVSQIPPECQQWSVWVEGVKLGDVVNIGTDREPMLEAWHKGESQRCDSFRSATVWIVVQSFLEWFGNLGDASA